MQLIDFGLAGEVPEGEEFMDRNFVGGTRDYMSPESLQCYVIEDGALDIEAMKQQNVSFISKLGCRSIDQQQLQRLKQLGETRTTMSTAKKGIRKQYPTQQK